MTQLPRVAIHGFGRTGRQAFKVLWSQYRERMEIAAIGLEDVGDAAAAAHLLKYDSNYGRFAPQIVVQDGCLHVDRHCIPLVSAPVPSELPWSDLGVDIVVEATGAYASHELASGHLAAGAKKVIVTAPCDDADISIIYGANEAAYAPDRHHVIATESGTANALVLVLKVLDGRFMIRNGLMTAVRAYSNTQKLLDSTDRDLRRARSAPMSIVPTTTRAPQAVGRHFPHLGSRLSGYAVHVPVPTVSILELTIELETSETSQSINEAFREAATGPLGRVLGVSDRPLVSSDYVGESRTAVVDTLATVTVGPMAKVGAWYDNEWGYSHRVADVVALVAA